MADTESDDYKKGVAEMQEQAGIISAAQTQEENARKEALKKKPKSRTDKRYKKDKDEGE